MRRIGICIAALMALGSAALSQDAEPTPAPLPEPEARAAAEAAVREAFGEALDASTHDERIAVAGRLIETAASTEAAASKLVLYEHAASLAALAGKPELVCRAIEPIVEGFDVEPIRYQHDALTAAQRWIRSADDAAYLAEALLELHREALAADAYDLALRLARQAESPARIARSAPLRRTARAAEVEARRLHNAYRQIEEHRHVLAETPDDPGANEAVGRFYLFEAGQVRRGAEHLAKGGDETLATLAKGELAEPDEAAAQAELAGRWWRWAEPRRGVEQSVGLGRAAYWYERAIEGLEGLAKVTAEKRLDAYYERYAAQDGIVVEGDVALAERGAEASAPNRPEALIDGNDSRYDGSDGFASGHFPSQFIVDLGKTYRLKRVRILLWDGSDRSYKYTASVSVDGRRWDTIADHADKPSKSWQTIDFQARPVRHIRVTGLHNTANAGFHIVEVQAYCRTR